jgi:aminoglycoside/choline kinase family phosphotransferase
MQRQQQLTDWLLSLYPNENFTIAPASADASFRRYFRVSFTNKSLIIMDAPPQLEDCKPFLHVGKLFAQAGVNVPHVEAQDLEQGFLLLTDLGKCTYLQALNEKNAFQLYADAADALIKIQLASRENELPDYDEALLRRELNLFSEWYITRHLGVTLTTKQSDNLERAFKCIIANNLAQPRVYVHRDYHSRNLMLSEPNGHARFPHLIPLPQAGEEANEKRNFLSSPGILDFQDAVYGPITYDLASLFKDAYIKWDEEIIMDWIIRYWEKARKAGLPVREDFGEFYRDYELMGVQRHLKVLGIFARLYHRDGKDGYLQDMPLVMNYLRRACERYIDLKPLLNLLMELEQQKEANDNP